MSPKSICHITFSEFPNDQRVRRYVNELVGKGFKVTVVCIRDEFHKLSEYTDNLRIIRLKVPKKRAGYGSRLGEYILFFIKSFFYSVKVYFTERVRIYHLHTFPDFIVFSALIPRLLGARLILDMHELTPEAMMLREGYGERYFIIRFLMLLEKISVMFAHRVITIHDIAAEILSSRNKKNFIPVMNGVDEREIISQQKKSDGYFNIVYNGTINPNLNLTLVIEAMNVIRDLKGEEVSGRIRFLLYGKGPDINRIISRAEELGLSDNVIYHGVVDHNAMLEKLSYASAMVYPPVPNIYTDICYPIKITEMISLCIPVIASRYRTLCYYYPEECFFYFDPGNVQMLAEKILEVMNNPGKVKTKTEAALKKYKNYSWEVMKERYMKLINELGAYEKV